MNADTRMQASKYLRSTLIAFSVFAAGCASHTGVVSVGKDTYMIAKQQGTGFPGLGNMKAELIQEAAAYCSAQNKQSQLLSTQETQPPYILGNYPRSEIQFSCVSQSP